MDVRRCTKEDSENLPEALREPYQGQLSGRWDLLTAWDGTALAGHGLLRWEGPLLPAVAAALPGQVELAFLHVEPDWRGRGVGTKLIGLAENRALFNGRTSLGLAVESVNTRARGLYIRLGYRATGVTYDVVYPSQDEAGDTIMVQESGTYYKKELPIREAGVYRLEPN